MQLAGTLLLISLLGSAHALSTKPRQSVSLNVASVLSSSSPNESLTAPPPPSDQTKLLYDAEGYPQLGSIARMLPKDTFHIDTTTSLGYFAIDAAAILTTMSLLAAVIHSNLYHSLPVWQQGLMVAPLQVWTGFSLWCMWCIGHDAGHSVVSNKNWVNQVVGEMAHSVFCLTPFVPWQLSHRRHHVHHNHLTRDYSHQWFVREESDELAWWIKLAYETRILQLPILYLIYLLGGIPDGGHVVFFGRLWEGQPKGMQRRGAISVATSVATAMTLWATLGTADFFVVYMVPWMVMSFWLFMVTYLQHHSDDGKLYTDETFSFVKGAFETVDRSYGKWVNRMSHHMVDGHVVHHLFFEKVPHYRLEAATQALQEGLAKEGQEHLYKQIDTPNFTQEVVKQFNDNWFYVNEEQVVRR